MVVRARLALLVPILVGQMCACAEGGDTYVGEAPPGSAGTGGAAFDPGNGPPPASGSGTGAGTGAAPNSTATSSSTSATSGTGGAGGEPQPTCDDASKQCS